MTDEEIYRKYADDLVRFATGLVGPFDAPDVVTDACLRSFRSDGWHDVANHRAYLYRSVLNQARSHHRTTLRRRVREMRTATTETAMPVEIDVTNPDHRLAAGMFPEVRWPIRGASPTFFVPVSSVVTTTEDTFVLHVKDHMVAWVSVRKGTKSGSMIEVFGALQAGDFVVLRGTDELRPGTVISPLPVSLDS